MTAPTIPEVDVTSTDAIAELDDPRERLLRADAAWQHAWQRAEQLVDPWRRLRALAARDLRAAGVTLREIGELLDVGQTEVGRVLAKAEEFVAEESARPRLSAVAKDLLVAVRDLELDATEGVRDYLPDVDPDRVHRAVDRLVEVGYAVRTPVVWGEPWPGQPLRLTRAGLARAGEIAPE
jgi:hypothetical protein